VEGPAVERKGQSSRAKGRGRRSRMNPKGNQLNSDAASVEEATRNGHVTPVNESGTRLYSTSKQEYTEDFNPRAFPPLLTQWSRDPRILLPLSRTVLLYAQQWPKMTPSQLQQVSLGGQLLDLRRWLLSWFFLLQYFCFYNLHVSSSHLRSLTMARSFVYNALALQRISFNSRYGLA
jgi:hypothetical protein